MAIDRNKLRWILVGLAAAIAVAVLVFRSAGDAGPASAGDAKGGGNRPGSSEGDAGDAEGKRKAPGRRGGDEKRALNLSGGDAARAFAIYDGSRQYLKEAELNRASVFSEFQDADGNSSSTMRLERPSVEELDKIFEAYLKSLSRGDRKFVEETGLSTNIKKDIADFFGYGDKFRYVTFLLAGDGSASLPTVLIFESDKLYNGDDASKGKLDIPATELRLKDYGDLKVGDPKLERYGRLFSIN